MENKQAPGLDQAIQEDRQLTFGEKAIGTSFNPSGIHGVDRIKAIFANAIDEMNNFRKSESSTAEQKRLASIAITEAQGAQMWAVKALTWKD